MSAARGAQARASADASRARARACGARWGQVSHQHVRHAPGPGAAAQAAVQREPEPEAEGARKSKRSLAALALWLTPAPCHGAAPQVYFLEEKYRTQVARLGAPHGVDTLLSESLEVQVQLKAAQDEVKAKDELLGA